MRFMVLSSDAERRDGLRALLRQIDRHSGYNDAKDWRQAMRLVRQQSFDLIVVDFRPTMRLGDLRALCEACAPTPVAMLVDTTSPAIAPDQFSTGVQGVVPRGMGAHLVIRAFELVLLGGYYVPPGALNLIDADAAEQRATRRLGSIPLRRQPTIGTLSPRQAQIMRFVHMGNTNKMIARTLGISEGTVKIHLASIFQQLGAANRAAAVAIYNGWLPPHLEVLIAERRAQSRPTLGASCPIPLRAASSRGKYRPITFDGPDLPIAAEPEPATLKRNT
ncbi:LuxR C-terminal-related transcriptional regulator [Burkholderia plantarii]|uniref:LuxR C-terminal-related transcriptional regulator n=1 Tax=Burkholderia plantarii TaxID=41899 RepID=UPI0018DC9E18|nr:response regulator transcription factor [Burkholderia plantarii]MBI0327818.1 response regulator transcription factor [Burkholderia plantarii]